MVPFVLLSLICHQSSYIFSSQQGRQAYLTASQALELVVDIHTTGCYTNRQNIRENVVWKRSIQIGLWDPSVNCSPQGPRFSLLPKLKGTAFGSSSKLSVILMRRSHFDSGPIGGACTQERCKNNKINTKTQRQKYGYIHCWIFERKHTSFFAFMPMLRVYFNRIFLLKNYFCISKHIFYELRSVKPFCTMQKMCIKL